MVCDRTHDGGDGARPMTVYFIGAGPGAADLITVRGQRLLQRCEVCLYAGSIMPSREDTDLLKLCPPGARIVDTGPLTLEEIIAEIQTAHEEGRDVARLHSGDPSIYSAIAEQCRRLDALLIDYEIVPGVPAFAAAAAVLGRELTVPGVAQTVTLTRVATLSTPMPNREDLSTLAASGDPGDPPGRPPHRRDRAAAAQRRLLADTRPRWWLSPAGPGRWCCGHLDDIAAQVHDAQITRTAVIIVGNVSAAEDSPIATSTPPDGSAEPATDAAAAARRHRRGPRPG